MPERDGVANLSHRLQCSDLGRAATARLPNDRGQFKIHLPMRIPQLSATKMGCLLLFLAVQWPSRGADFVGGALRFEPPAIVGINELTRAPDGMPFAGDALGVDCYTDENRDGFGWLRLQFIWAGVAVSDGKRIKYSMTTTNEFVQFIKDTLSKNPSPLNITVFEGFPSAVVKSSNSSPRTRLHEAVFVQVKTNIVLRMTVSAQTETVFDALTASLKTVRIDLEKLFEFIRPKEPKITVIDAAKAEIGFAPLGDREVLAIVFRSKDSTWSMVGSLHFDQESENELFEKLSGTLNDLGNQSVIRETPLRATLEVYRTGDGPDELQRSITFHMGELRNSRSSREGTAFSIMRLLNQKSPDGFRKVRELPFRVNLAIEDHSSR
jgi:hypothetical protein